MPVSNLSPAPCHSGRENYRTETQADRGPAGRTGRAREVGAQGSSEEDGEPDTVLLRPAFEQFQGHRLRNKQGRRKWTWDISFKRVAVMKRGPEGEGSGHSC